MKIIFKIKLSLPLAIIIVNHINISRHQHQTCLVFTLK